MKHFKIGEIQNKLRSPMPEGGSLEAIKLKGLNKISKIS
jgi:hypothetical protein